MTSLIWVGVSVCRISLVCACTALYPTADKGCTAMDDDDGYGYKKAKKVARQWCGWCKEVQGKEGQWAWGHHEEQEWGVAVMMVGGDYEKH